MTGIVPSNSTRDLLTERAREYSNQITPEAAQYLTNRGIGKSEAQRFQLGFVNEPLEGDDLYHGRITIPYITPSGVVAMKFRALGDTEPKYLTFSGTTTKRLYNTTVLMKPKLSIYITEGEIDTLTATILGLPAVGVPGVTQWQSYFSRIFRNRRVLVLADNDDSGQGLQFAQRIQSDVENCGVILMPPGKDLNQFYIDEGKEAVIEYIRKGARA